MCSSLLDRLSHTERALTVSQLADLLGLHKLTIYRLCGRGLPHFRLGAAIRFCPASVAAYLRAHLIGGAQ